MSLNSVVPHAVFTIQTASEGPVGNPLKLRAGNPYSWSRKSYGHEEERSVPTQNPWSQKQIATDLLIDPNQSQTYGMQD